MKRIFTVLAIMVGLVLPMQAQFTPVKKDIKANVERKMIKKAVAASDITIEDITGEFEAYAVSAFENQPDEEWIVTITADEADANKVWIVPICEFGAPASPVYATFNAADATLSLPMGQCVYEDDTYKLVLGTSTDGSNVDTESSLTMNIIKSEMGVVLELDALFGVGNINANEWWYQALGYTIFAKEFAVPTVYIYTKDNEMGMPTRVNSTNLFFNTIDGETCVVSKAELPTDAIAGTYAAYAMSAFQGFPDESWEMTITRDENDANKVWLHPICQFGYEDEEVLPVYATYNEATGELILPMGQCVYGGAGQNYNMVIATVDANYDPLTTGNLTLQVQSDGMNNFIEIDAILGVGNLAEGDAGWWYQALGYTSYTRDGGIAIPVANIERISRQAPDAPETNGFLKEGSYTWNFQFSGDGETWSEVSTTTQMTFTDMFDLGLVYGEEAAGIVATQWDVNGFMVDLGFFEGGTPSSFPAINYNIELEGTTYEYVDLLDPVNGPCHIGKLPLQNQDGSQFTADVYLADFDGQYIYYNLGFMLDEGAAYFTGTEAVMWFEQGGNAYILASLSDIVLSKSDNATVAPARVKSATVKMFNEPIPVQIGGVKKMNIK